MIPVYRRTFQGQHRRNGEANTTLSISIWDQRPDPAIMESLMEQFKAQVRDISAAPPVVEEYETLVHFGDLARGASKAC